MGLLYSLDKKYILINTIFEVVMTVNGKIWGFLVCDAVHLRQIAPLKCHLINIYINLVMAQLVA